tara:strand:+ start:51 stop:344 length:294 start_codon:yes stop_codon:yes gene_type:complete
MGSLIAQNKNQLPKQTVPFNLSYYDFNKLDTTEWKGEVIVSFVIDEMGKVVNPEIIDTFNIELNETIIDKVMAIEFKPALQNGRPVRVKYKLPILFK